MSLRSKALSAATFIPAGRIHCVKKLVPWSRYYSKRTRILLKNRNMEGYRGPDTQRVREVYLGRNTKNNSAEYTKANREHSPCYKLAQNTTRK